MKVITAFLSISLLMFSGTILGDDDRDQDEVLKLRQQGVILPLEKILQAATQLHPGRVVEVELQKEHGLLIYELELVDEQGQVWEMKIDAKDGKLLSSERED